MLKMANKKAQSTLEYIIVLTAIIGLIIYAAVNWIRPAVNNSLDNASAAIRTAADKF
jgi:uncharacterized protein (UPF0333 family)